MVRTSPETLRAVERATRRSSGRVHEEMRAGVSGLATIASLAPLAGLFGTVLTFPSAFPGFSGQRSALISYMFEHFAGAMELAAFGLAVGLMSLWFYLYLSGRIRGFDVEMENASLELLNQLSHFRGAFVVGPRASPGREPDVRGSFS